MSLNPTMLTRKLPLPLRDELFYLERPGIACEVISAGLETLSTSGQLILTSLRMVFIAKEPKPYSESNITFVAFELPLAKIRNEKFNQPIFGCNHLAGYVNSPRNDMCFEFKLFFKTGGAGTFLPAFTRCLHTSRQIIRSENAELEAKKRHEELLEQMKE